MRIVPKIIKFSNEEKETLKNALAILTQFSEQTAYQLEFEDEHMYGENARCGLDDFIFNMNIDEK